MLLQKDTWNLSIPKGKGGPTLIESKDIDSYNDEFVKHTDVGIELTTPANGVTTPNSHYPRTEFRELDSGKLAKWDAKKTTRNYKYSFSVNHLPKNKPEIVIGQLHDPNDDVFEIKVSGEKLLVFHNSTIYSTVYSDYKLDQTVDVDCKIGGGNALLNFKRHVGETKFDMTHVTFKLVKTKDVYFKVGCYLQTNPDHGDAGEYGKVTLKALIRV